ncbi:unnamed protein product [Cunninghamella blakesleeana]
MVHHLSGEIGLDYDINNTTTLLKASNESNENEMSTNVISNPTTQTLLNEILNIYQQLKNAQHLRPSEHINSLFTKLVHICILPIDQNIIHQVLNDHSILDILYSLRELCSQGEYQLETFWSSYITSSSTTNDTMFMNHHHDDDHWVKRTKKQLSKFVYYQNYVDLTRIECYALLGVGASLKRVAFIGSGPLPLSSIEMILQHHSTIERIDNVDIDQEAIRLSTELTQNLALPKNIQSRFFYYQSDATLYQGYDQADVVCLGALVGGDNHNNKFDILIHVAKKMRPGSWLLIRSAHGLRQLLYPSLSPIELNTCSALSGLLEVVLELHPHHDVVNSVLIAKRL